MISSIESPSHQAQTAIAGMWLFLATEVLFFGGLILSWIYSRHWNQAGFDAGARETELWIGTLNTGILITSSFVYAAGWPLFGGQHPAADPVLCDDAASRPGFPGAQVRAGMARGFRQTPFPDRTGLQDYRARSRAGHVYLFLLFHRTGLHGLHMVIGVGLVGVDHFAGTTRRILCAYFTPVHAGGPVLELRRHRLADALPAHLSDREALMLRLFGRLVISILIMAVIDAIGLKGSGRSTQTRVHEGTVAGIHAPAARLGSPAAPRWRRVCGEFSAAG